MDNPTPPLDAQAMTREEFERTVYILSAGNVPRGGQVLAHDAAQRETIRRLEEKLSSSRQEVDRAVYDYCVMKEKKDDLQARLTASEREVRHRMWTLHYSRMQHVPYGDDGRLDCNSCGRDYVATPMDELVQWEMLDASKLVTASEAKRKWTTARPTVAGLYWHRWSDGSDKQIVKVQQDTLTRNWFCYHVGSAITYSIPRIDDRGDKGEWQGPLTPGEE